MKLYEHDLVEKYVTREIINDIFGDIVSRHGGWRQPFMSDYIEDVLSMVKKYASSECDYMLLRQEVVKKMKELDPMLFQKNRSI